MEAITNLFWSRGYEGVSMSDILEATGLHKGSLYRSFGDKPRLYEMALARYGREVVDAGCTWLRDDSDGQDPNEKLADFLQAPIDARFGGDDRRGCFLCNASADETDGQPRIEDLIQGGFDKLEAALGVLIARAYPAAKSDTVGAAASLVLTTYVGLRVRSRHVATARPLEDARAALLQSLPGIVGAS